MRYIVTEPFEFLGQTVDNINITAVVTDSMGQTVHVSDLYAGPEVVYRDRAFIVLPTSTEITAAYVNALTVTKLDKLGVMLGLELSGTKSEKQAQTLEFLGLVEGENV